ELGHTDAHLLDRLAERLARELRRAADRRHLARVLARPQLLHQVRGRLPAPRPPTLQQPLRIPHRQGVRFVAHPGERPQRGQVLEEPIPYARPFHLDARHLARLRARRRSGSRAKMFERWTSTKGTRTARSASRSARLVCVNAAALMTAPSARPFNPWMASTSSPSWFVCLQESSTPSARARSRVRASISTSVVLPYSSGSRSPKRFRLGPFSTAMCTRTSGPSTRLGTGRGRLRPPPVGAPWAPPRPLRIGAAPSLPDSRERRSRTGPPAAPRRI